MPNEILGNMLDAALGQVNAMKAEASEYELALQRYGGVIGNLEKQVAQMENALNEARVNHGRETDQIKARLEGLTAEFDRIMAIRESLKL